MGFPRAGSIPAHSGALDCILCCTHCILEMQRSDGENAKHVARQTSKWSLTASWSLTYVHFKLHKSKLQAACLSVELVVLLWPHALKILPRLCSFHIMVCLSKMHFTAGQQGGVPHCIGGCIVHDKVV